LRRNDFEDNIGDLDDTLLDKEDEDSQGSPSHHTSTNIPSEPEIPTGKVEHAQDASLVADKGSDTETPSSDSKFFAVRTTGGQEHVVVNMAQNKINSKNIPVRSILLLESFKGYIIVEAPNSNIAYEALAGIRHVKGQIRGELPYKDIEGYLVKRPIVTELNIDDTVEVVAGPFKSMKAKITRVDYEKQEATVLLLDSPYQIPVTVDANYLKKMTL
jgi:transcription termination/antitermination protein NusG